jgi:hypothetical protein
MGKVSITSEINYLIVLSEIDSSKIALLSEKCCIAEEVDSSRSAVECL